MLVKTVLWVLGGFRKIPSTLMPSSLRSVQTAGRSGHLSPSQAESMAKFVESERLEALHEYVKGGRIDPLLVMPELAMSQCHSKLDRMRELAHIARPLVYASVYIYGRSPRAKWAGWSAALALDLFASWPTISSHLTGSSSTSTAGPLLAVQEEKTRLVNLLYYILREPFYTDMAKSRLDALKDSLREWRLLKPLVETVDTYQKLCESVHFYTSAS